MTRIGSLCSGYEGLGGAIQSVIGGELAWVADNDPGAAAILAHRFPSVPNLGDIKAIDWFSLDAVDVLCGGYPCQPFSQAGLRLGAADERHIWPYIATAIDVLRPGLVVLENVQGHLTLGFDIVLADLAKLGYDAEWVTVTASAAGACHRRARLFILASPARARVVIGVPVAVIRDGLWLEPCESLFGAEPFTGRVPASGRMAAGRVYTAEAALNAMAAGLLKTPTAQLAVNGGSQHPDKRRAGGHGPTLADQVEHELLPTPMTGYSQRAPGEWRAGRPAGNGATREKIGDLAIVAEHLLPTPTAADGDRASLNYEQGNPTLLGALLPTPQATDGQGGPRAVPEERTHRGTDHGPRLRDVAPALLPTPAARDGKGRDMPGREGGKSLPETLLPTPMAADGGLNRGSSAGFGLRNTSREIWRGDHFLPTPTAASNGKSARAMTASVDNGRRSGGGQSSPPGLDEIASMLSGERPARLPADEDLPPATRLLMSQLLPTPSAGNFNDGEDLASWEIAGDTDWGPYEAAIRRWEAVTGQPAPRPTVPGKTGERLNPALPEWMMGLPAGWITEVPGLSRSAQLKLAGNGVVPAQAELALRILLARAFPAPAELDGAA